MTLDSLLVSRDMDVVRVLRATLEKLAINVEVSPGAHAGGESLTRSKFDAVIVDGAGHCHRPPQYPMSLQPVYWDTPPTDRPIWPG